MSPSLDEKPAGQGHGDVSRRDFIKGGVVGGAVAAGSMGAFYFGYGAAEGNPVRVGVLGTGDEGNILIGAINPDYVEVKAIADIRPYNVWRAFNGDNANPTIKAMRRGLMSVYGWETQAEAERHVKVYGGYQELLNNAKADGIEAVIIALPLHLHAPAAIAAMKAGLHVLTEKLMGHSVHECKEMCRVAKATHKHLATGHQRHYNILYENAMDTIRRGELGELHYIRAQWHRGNMPGKDSWQMPMPKELKPDDTQVRKLLGDLANWKKSLAAARGREIDVWAMRIAQLENQILDRQIKALDYGYEDTVLKGGGKEYNRPAAEELIRWRLWQRTGGGLMAELGSHQLDASSIFISAMHGGKKQQPISVMCASNRPIFGIDREADDHVCCIYEFPGKDYNPDPKSPNNRKRIGVQYASINGNGYGGYGEIVYGTKGTLILEKEQDVTIYRDESASKVKTSSGPAALDTQASGAAQKATEASGPANVSRGYQEEIEHWAWCIRVNPNNTNPDCQPRCYPKVAMADAVIALTTNIAAEKGERIEFKESWFDPDSDETPEGVTPDITRY